jgi:hypothetical protein
MFIVLLTVPLMVIAVAIATVPLLVTTAAEHRRSQATVPVSSPSSDRPISVGGPTR